MHLVGGGDEALHLLCRERVGVDAECEAIDGGVEHGVILLGERVLHIADGSARHQFPCGLLVVEARHCRPNQQHHHDGGFCHSPLTHPMCRRKPQTLEKFALAARDEMGEAQTKDAEDMTQNDEQYPPHRTEHDIGRDARLDEFACLTRVGLTDKEEHRGREGGLELHKAIDIHHRRGVEHRIKQGPDP